MRLRQAALLTAISGIFATVARPASAQSPPPTPGFAINRFHASERGSDWFILDSVELVGHLRPAAGLVLDWGYKPLSR